MLPFPMRIELISPFSLSQFLISLKKSAPYFRRAIEQKLMQGKDQKFYCYKNLSLSIWQNDG
jgi:hypothetical protein